MRKNKWLPRRVGREPERGPRTIQQVREDAARDGCIYMPQEASPPAKTPTGLGVINPFDRIFNRKLDDFFGPSLSGPVASSTKPHHSGGYLSAGYTGAYGDDLSPLTEGNSRPFSNGYSNTEEDVAAKDSQSPKSYDNRQNSYEGKEDVKQADKQAQGRIANRDLTGVGITERSIGPSGDTKDEPDGNRRDNFDSNNRRQQNQGHYNNMNSQRNDQYHNRRGGGGRGAGERDQDSYNRQQRVGNNYRDNREEDIGNSLPPPVDFGDRYSANRTKDRERRQQQGNNDWGNNGNRQNNEYHRGDLLQRGGRGGRFDNYHRDGRNNQVGGPPRFNQRPDDRYNDGPTAPQQPPRFQRNISNDSQSTTDSNNSNVNSDRLAPRFKKMSLGQVPPERSPGDIGMGGPPPNREQVGRTLQNNRQVSTDQRYQDRPGIFQQPPPNYQPNAQRNLGMLGPGKIPIDQNNPRMMYQGGPPHTRMEKEGSVGFTDRRSEGSNSRERELGLSGPMGPPKEVELSLRPPPANMLFKPKTPSLLPKSAIGRINDHGSSPLGENSLLGPPPMQIHQKVMMQQKESPILIKQGSLDGKGRKEKNRQAAAAASKGPTAEEVFEKVDSIIDDMLAAVRRASIDNTVNEVEDTEKQDGTKEEVETDPSDNLITDEKDVSQEKVSKDEAVSTAIESATNRWNENGGWLPPKMTQPAVTHIYKKIILEILDNNEREIILNFLLQLNKGGMLEATHFREAFDKVMSEKLENREQEKEKGDEQKDDWRCWMQNAEQVINTHTYLILIPSSSLD